ncbi:MAG TPA: hypothetical protein VFI15_07510 [Candidatus Limnocylindrales bacterium]|jgi:hypothetical protein|nr:hypothetical protein [Candidatus Limnocylindrales bacterium]
MANAQAPAARPRRELEPTHPCVRCGREGVPADAGLCELCNPLELAQPSATQMHGIAAVGIIAFVIVLAVLGRATMAGNGPFTGTVAGVIGASDGLSITVTVRNEGTRDTATTCEIDEQPARPGTPSQVIQTPLIRAGDTVTFTTLVTKFGTTPIALAADCTST